MSHMMLRRQQSTPSAAPAPNLQTRNIKNEREITKRTKKKCADAIYSSTDDRK